MSRFLSMVATAEPKLKVANALESPSIIRFTKDVKSKDALNPFNSPSVRVNGGNGNSKSPGKYSEH
jgi:hypothetical protein